MSTIRATYVQHGSSAVPNITLNASGQVIVASGIVSSGTFAAPTGSAAAPGVYFVGDTNTGLYSPGADQVAVATNGSGRLFVDASGNIGAGYSTPGNFAGGDLGATRPLVVGDGTASTNVNIFSDSTGYGHLAFSDGTSGTSPYAGLIQYYHVNDSMALYTAATERLRITSAGLVGIGTSSPGAQTDSRITGVGAAPATSGTSQPNAAFRVSGTGTTGVLDIGCNGDTPWIQSTDRTDLSQKYALLLNPNGGNVGIGTQSPSFVSGYTGLQADGGGNGTVIKLTNSVTGSTGTDGFDLILQQGGSDAFVWQRESASLLFGTAATERARIDSSGRLLVGTSTSRIVEDLLGNGPQGLIQIEAANSDAIMSIISAGTADASRGGTLSLGRHRNATVGGTPTVVQSGDLLGAICFAGGDGTDMRTKGASIACQVDGTPGADDMPGRLVFSTTADGASSPTERMRIDSSGNVGIGTAVNATRTVDIKQPSGYVAGLRVLTDGSGAYNQFFSGISNFRIGSPHNTNALVFDDAASERARIDSSGRLLVNTSSALGAPSSAPLQAFGSTNVTFFQGNTAASEILTIYGATASGDNVFALFSTDSLNTRGTIDYNRAGGQVRYNVTSDRRLKSGIQPAGSALDDLAAIQVRAYKWTETDYQINYGFVAQELYKVAPDAVKKGDDSEEITDIWAVDNSKLVPLLTKALQEAITKIETLEARLTAAGIE